jgi:hypothetical protein
MNNVVFTEGKQYESSYGMTGKGLFTPVYVIANGRTYFLHNFIQQIDGESLAWRKMKNEQNAKEDARHREQLISNDGKWVTFYGHDQNPIDFLKWVSDQNYTIEIWRNLFYTEEEPEDRTPYTDFHGNLVEYSAAFHYRIFDPELLEQIKAECKNIRQRKYC